MIKEYSPDATAYAVRCSPSALRDWRRHGFLKSLSERLGKGHLFSLSDVARIAVAAFLARNGATLQDAFAIVSGIRGGVIDSTIATLRDGRSASDYFLTFTVNPDTSWPTAITGAPVAKIAFDEEPVATLQVNVTKFLATVLARLQTAEAGEDAA
ncbi:MAG: hypothetical protein JSS22_04710 [Proteobacteria bacterium]|nr:hypothetical protein [Pseudomonadota bacterium]